MMKQSSTSVDPSDMNILFKICMQSKNNKIDMLSQITNMYTLNTNFKY